MTGLPRRIQVSDLSWHENDRSICLRPDPLRVAEHDATRTTQIYIVAAVEEVCAHVVACALLRLAGHTPATVAVQIVCFRRRICQVCIVKAVPVIIELMVVSSNAVDILACHLDYRPCVVLPDVTAPVRRKHR